MTSVSRAPSTVFEAACSLLEYHEGIGVRPGEIDDEGGILTGILGSLSDAVNAVKDAKTENMALAEEQVGPSLWMLEPLSRRNVLLNVAAAIARGRRPIALAAEQLRDFDGYFIAEDPARQDEANAVWNAFVEALGGKS